MQNLSLKYPGISERLIVRDDERAPGESEQLLADIINFLPDATMVIDREHRVLAWNRAIEEMTSIKAADMLGKGDYAYSIPFYGIARPLLIDIVLKPNFQNEIQYDNLIWEKDHLSGERFCPALGTSGRYIYSTSSPLYNRQGEIIGAVESLRDITERIEVERQLKERESNLRKMMELAPGILYILQDDRLRYANPTLCRKLGYSEQEILSKSLRELIHPDNWELVSERAIARQRGEDVPARYEIQLLTSNDEGLWIDLTATTIEYKGAPAILGMANDVTATRQLYQAWEKTETTFRHLTDTIPALIYIIQNYHYRYVNKFFTTISGYELKDLEKINALDIIHPDYRAVVDVELRKLSKEPENHVYRQDIRLLPRDGTELWIDFSASLFQWEGKRAVIGAAYNVTHRKQLEAALVQSENNFRLLAETAPVLIFLIQDGKLVYTNKLFSEVTGYTAEECRQMNPTEFIDSRDCDWLERITGDEESMTAGRNQGRIRTKSGRVVWGDFNLTQMTFNGEKATLGTAVDITDQKRAQLEIEYLNYYDKLTGLHNRAYLEEELKYLDNSARLPISLIIGDVNGLKLVNDAFGHQSGDLMLQKVAQILKANCRKSDLVARWGGDEFLIILPQSREEVAWRICSNVYEDCKRMNDFPVPVSIALGVAAKYDPGQNLEELFKQAEDLMYRNKMLENRSARSSFLNSLEQTLWVRSHETQAHTQRLRRMVVAVGNALNLLPDEINSLTLLASLHDIGKIAIPNSVLDKPGALTDEEWELMKKHPEIGYRIALSNPELAPIADAILNHHERWDGRGYPLGAREQEIPLLSRILALADAFDVMVSGRPYQEALSREAAFQEISNCSGTQFDPDLAEIFIELLKAQVNI